MDVFATLTNYANPPNNVIGSTLFLTYIALALYSTVAITTSLWKQYNTIAIPKTAKNEAKKELQQLQDARRRHIKIYAFLASISFATASYHMSLFLLNSFATWNDKTTADLTLSDLRAEKLKSWMLESTLFESFAKDLVSDGPSAAWTQGAVLGTWFWGVWMGQKVQSRRIPTSQILPYLLLSQTLPITTTISLFLINLHLSAPEISPTPLTFHPATPSPPKKKTSLTLPTILLNTTVFALPSLRHTPYFIPLVLLTRLVLLTPFSARVGLKDAQVVQSIAVSGGFVVAHVYMLRKVSGFGELARGAWRGGEAVRALAWDAGLGVVVHGVLGWGGGV
ncbi:hypothetical protein CC80DRAFT_556240 [Byssothecium circinans]|uniref:Uncharacterized protein n=1 Tax=Byssothecium circinans TaxID=147558 RepID=A0A6A5THX9_9PLEO|nr:hypothetical protein CC80DRAFT_556240 [Byssothecium circinans]